MVFKLAGTHWKISGLPLCAWALLSCSPLPQLGDGNPESLAEDEKRIWVRSREESVRLDKSGQLDDSKELNEYLNSVVLKLLPGNLRAQNFSPNVKVIKNPLLNAFALSHGAIYIHSGFIARMENEAQLAVLLGHELAHIIHRHPIQHFRWVQNVNASFALLTVATARAGVYANLINLLGVFGAPAAISGYSRTMESEADETGLQLVVAAGYNPKEAITLFDHLEQQLKDRSVNEPFFFGSHPRVLDRKLNYERLVGSKYSGIEGFAGVTEYSAHTSRVVLETANFNIGQGRWNWAKEGIERFITKNPDHAQGYFHLAELYRSRSEDGDLHRAEQAFVRTLQLDPNFALAYRGLGLIHLKKGDRGEASVAFHRFLVLQPEAHDREFIEPYIMKTKEAIQ